MSARTALVTGATGGLGRHVIGALIANGYGVRASGRNKAIGGTLASLRDVQFIAGDLADAALAPALVDGVDVVFHCAALSTPWGPHAHFQIANVVATRNLIDAAKQAGCSRFVHISTPSLTFRFRDQLGIKETDPLPPKFVNSYAATKAEAEQIVRAAASHRLAVTILRPRGLFGEFDTVLVPRLMDAARTGKIPVFNNGDALVDVTYAGNVADAMVLCDRPDAPTGTFNITNGEPLTVRDLLQQAFLALGRDVTLRPTSYVVASTVAGSWEMAARILRVHSLGLMRYSQTLDITAARDQLGYVPRVTIAEGLQRFARWLDRGRPDWLPDHSVQPRGTPHAMA
jgi:nucleoside-diphosphate-sugar epimerase